MKKFFINSENTEDTFGSAGNLQDAIRIAKEVTTKGQAGDPVCIAYKGKNIMQFVLIPGGKVEEMVLDNVIVELEGRPSVRESA